MLPYCNLLQAFVFKIGWLVYSMWGELSPRWRRSDDMPILHLVRKEVSDPCGVSSTFAWKAKGEKITIVSVNGSDNIVLVPMFIWIEMVVVVGV